MKLIITRQVLFWDTGRSACRENDFHIVAYF